ncbi:uncharacterized protein LOC106079446 [Biomphalaria glabrata]|uniref:Uncharacterized protein LOC106079446 n=1 Tax=Biomphalaria glabrata TaxID=6526 RepID=A0A9W2Z671_BIOGL|nr:uncharacterized protein LOC106079446 [Biomphalaria glabrata]
MGKILKYSLIGLIVIIIAFILIIVGVATDGWVFRSGVNYKVSLSSTTGDAKGEASYAFCIISTLGAATALTCVALDVVLQFMEKRSESFAKVLPLVTLIASIVGGIFGLIGAFLNLGTFVAASFVTDYIPGYSFFLTVIGSIILLVGGGLAHRTKSGGNVEGI